MLHYKRVRSQYVIAFALIWLPTSVFSQTDDDVTRLIDQLEGTNPFVVRQAAQVKLEGFIKMNRLTPVQLGIIRTYPQAPDLEQLRRKEAILSSWGRSFPSVRTVLDSIKFETTAVFGRDWLYKFDGFFGGANTGDPIVVALCEKYGTARNKLLAAADTAGIVPALEELRNYVLDEQRFPDFFLANDIALRMRATREQVAAALDRAINEAQNAIRDINIGSNNVMPPARQPIPIQGKGSIDTGQTLRLALGSNPIMPGGLDIFIPPMT